MILFYKLKICRKRLGKARSFDFEKEENNANIDVKLFLESKAKAGLTVWLLLATFTLH